MATVIKTTFKLRRGLAAEWAEVNPILAEGEPGFATDTFDLKIGDGVTAWNGLPYISKGDVSISPDGQTLAYNENGQLSVIGFDSAEINSIPVKSELGQIIWIKLSPVATSGLIDDLTQRNTIILSCGGAPAASEEEISNETV